MSRNYLALLSSCFIALGLIIEEVTNDDIQHQINTRIISPLNLSNTFFPSTEVKIPFPHAKGYLRLADGQFADITELNPSLEWTARRNSPLSVCSSRASFLS